MDKQKWFGLNHSEKYEFVKDKVNILTQYLVYLYDMTFRDEETSDEAASYYYKYMESDNINRLINTIETEIKAGVPGSIEVRIMTHIIREFYNSKHKFDDEDIDGDYEETIAEIKFDNLNTVWRSDIVAKV